jgi:chromosomal replication initiation ATPase DnaA
MILSPAEIATLNASAILGEARLFWAIADDVCGVYGISRDDLATKGRGRLDVNEARQFLCLYAMRRGISSAQIGRFLDRDHTTILHATRQAEAKEKARNQGVNP